MSEAAPEPTVRLGPAIANLAKSVARQWKLVVVGVVLGLALGSFALPKVLNSRSTYQATVRMQVLQSPADAIFEIAPAIASGEDGGAGAAGSSTELLKDIAVANAVLKRPPGDLGALTGSMLLERLSFTPVPGTSFVDAAYSDVDPDLAAGVVDRYTKQFVSRRNAQEQQRFDAAVAKLEEYARGLRENPPRTGGGAPSAAGGGASSGQSALQSVAAQLNAARVKQAITGPPTSIEGVPVVTRTGTPVSDQVMLALGLLLGLAIGAGAGLLIEAAFRKVITQADAEDASGLPFIASVRKNGIRHTSLPVIQRPYSPAAEDYRRVGTALERQGLGGDMKVLAIVSPDPREGKTLLAVNLAHSLARQGRDVVLVSSDMRQSQMEKVLGLPPRPGLAQALQDEDANVVAHLMSINEHLLLLPAGLPGKHPGELLASRRLVEIVHALRKLGGIVILDTPPVRLSADAIALSGVADATLVVARSGVTRVRSLHEATSGLRRDRLRPLGVVLIGTASPWPWLRLPYGSHREHAEATEAGVEEQEPVAAQPRPVQLLSPRRAAPPNLPRHNQEPGLDGDSGLGGDLDATGEQR